MKNTFNEIKHIVFVIQRLQKGGAERQVSYLAKYLTDRSYKVSVFYFGSYNEDAAQWFNDSKIDLLPFGFNEKELFKKRQGIIKKVYSKRLIFKLIYSLRKIKPDILLPFTYEPNILLGRYWKLTGAKFCIWNQRDEGRYFMDTHFEFRSLKNCSGYIANSTAAASFLRQKTVNHIHVVYNAIDIKSPTTKSVTDFVHYVMVANFHIYKDHLTLLKAWYILVHEKKIHTIKLHLIGEKGNALNDIINFINENRLTESVILYHNIKNVFDFLQNCSVGILSSNKEGMPNCILEYMERSLPVAATQIPGTEDALGEDYPFLFSPGNAVRLASILEELFLSENLRHMWGEKNRKRVSDRFTRVYIGNLFEIALKNISSDAH